MSSSTSLSYPCGRRSPHRELLDPQHPQQLHPLAIAWVAAQGADIVPLVGARTRERLTEALPATEITLTADDLAAVEKAVPAGSARGDRYPPALTATPGVGNRVDRAR